MTRAEKNRTEGQTPIQSGNAPDPLSGTKPLTTIEAKGAPPMTWEQIKHSDKNYLTENEVGAFLDCDPKTLRAAIMTNRDLVGFHCSMIGQTLRIPRLAFIRWVEGGEP